MDARNLLEYDHALRNRYLEQFAMLPWEEVVKGRGASFDSLRNIFLHVIDVEDRTINYVIPGLATDWVPLTPEEFHDVGSIKKRVLEVESKTNAYLAKMTPDELERKVQYPMWGKPPVSVRVEDILIHVVLESIHHFGELIALLWQIDVVPPHMGWINYTQDKVAP
ncbi:MAG TPA: DinB family protein [Candidatus Bathyarchaeia archaeon]|nr:DinB family protein [Candidatus Bathyarchaeia archaeon]